MAIPKSNGEKELNLSREVPAWFFTVWKFL
jgi:hypothetical protein